MTLFALGSNNSVKWANLFIGPYTVSSANFREPLA